MVRSIIKNFNKNLPIVHFWTLGLEKSTIWHYIADIIVLIIMIIILTIVIVSGSWLVLAALGIISLPGFAAIFGYGHREYTKSDRFWINLKDNKTDVPLSVYDIYTGQTIHRDDISDKAWENLLKLMTGTFSSSGEREEMKRIINDEIKDMIEKEKEVSEMMEGMVEIVEV